MVDFYRRNEYPECVFGNLWDILPEEGQRVVVDYGNSTNEYIYFVDGKFVNIYGFEMNGILGWKPYDFNIKMEEKKVINFDYNSLNKQSSIVFDIYKDFFNRKELITLWGLKLIEKIYELHISSTNTFGGNVIVKINSKYFGIFKNVLELNLSGEDGYFRYGSFNNSIDFSIEDDVECIEVGDYKLIIHGYKNK